MTLGWLTGTLGREERGRRRAVHRGAGQRARRTIRTRHWRRLRVEALEWRQMLAADAVNNPLASEPLAGEFGIIHNVDQPADVNGDGHVAPLDALILMNALNGQTMTRESTELESSELESSFDDDVTAGSVPIRSALPEGEGASLARYYDVDGDELLTAGDLLGVLRALAEVASPTEAGAWDALSPLPEAVAVDPVAASADLGALGDGTWEATSDQEGTSSNGAPDAGSGDGSEDAAGAGSGTGSGDGSGDAADAGSTNDEGALTETCITQDLGGGQWGEGGPTGESSCVAPPPPECVKPPSVTVRNGGVYEGSTFTPQIVFGGDCLTAYSVSWGDGSTHFYTVGGPTVARHIYLDDGPSPGNGTPFDDYPVTVTVYTSLMTTATGAGWVRVHNVAPVANEDAYVIDEDTPSFHGNVLSNDTDVGPLDVLSVVSFDTAGTQGSVQAMEGGDFLYEPPASANCLAEGQLLVDSFRYTIQDDDGATATGRVTFHITGKREVYFLYYFASDAEEDGPKPADAFFYLDTTPTCHDVTINYAPADPPDYWIVPPDRLALPSDVQNPSGSVTIAKNTSSKSFEIMPVDDTIIERNEVYFWKALVTITPDYAVWPQLRQSHFTIRDDEWRFVSEKSNRKADMGPVDVAAYSSYFPPYIAYLSGDVTYDANYSPNLGTTEHSTAKVTADLFGTLSYWLTSDDIHNISGVEFVCNSQNGDVYHKKMIESGHLSDGPLHGGTEVLFDIDDQGQEEARAVVSLRTKLIAEGTIALSKKGSAQLGAGGYGKGSISGGLEMSVTVSGSGGDTLVESETVTFFCRRGEE